MAKKHTIWSNYNIDVKDWEDFLKEEYPDITDEYEKYTFCAEMNDEYLEDKKANLAHIELDEDVVIIGDLGRWNGRFNGYRIISPNNVGELLCFQGSAEYAEFYVDSYHNLKSKQSDHDGTSYYLYRMWKPNLSNDQKANFVNKIYYNKVTTSDISRYTVALGKEIAKVYGW